MRWLAALSLLIPLAGLAAGAADYVQLPGGGFRTALKYEDRKGDTRIAPFALLRMPGTNDVSLVFV